MARAATPSLRPAVEADLPFLFELRLATMSPHFARQGLAPSAEYHHQRAGYRLDAATIIEVDGHPVGVIKVVQDTRTWTIEQFQVAPAHQGRGLGTTVLRALIAEARHADALLHLSVLKQNPAAGLYARLGFRTLGETVHSYQMTFIETEAPPEA